MSKNALNHHWGSCFVNTGSIKQHEVAPPPNVKWYSETWPYTVTLEQQELAPRLRSLPVATMNESYKTTIIKSLLVTSLCCRLSLNNCFPISILVCALAWLRTGSDLSDFLSIRYVDSNIFGRDWGNRYEITNKGERYHPLLCLSTNYEPLDTLRGCSLSMIWHMIRLVKYW